MDEGRLGVVFRQEERHRKFIHLMNNIMRAQMGLYSSCLAREQHESSIKLMKNCVQMKRSLVRQKVLRKCLQMRKQAIRSTNDSSLRFGAYGGKPLECMSRDIDRVIADNHPRLRRAKEVEQAMRLGLQSGAILDEQTMARRVESFFQLKQGAHKVTQQQTGQRLQPRNATRGLRRIELPPIVDGKPVPGVTERKPSLTYSDSPRSVFNKQPVLRPLDTVTQGKTSERAVVANTVALRVDDKGRLRGVRGFIDTILEQDTDEGDVESSSQGAEEAAEVRGRSPQGPKGGADEAASKGPTQLAKDVGAKSRDPEGNVRKRPTLILPPIVSSKQLVSRV